MYAGPSLVSVSVKRARASASPARATRAATPQFIRHHHRSRQHAKRPSHEPRLERLDVVPKISSPRRVDRRPPRGARSSAPRVPSAPSPPHERVHARARRASPSRENEDIVVSVDARASSRSRVVVVVDAHLRSKGASTPRAARPRGRDDATARASRVDDGDEGDDAVYGEARGRRARALGDIGSHRARAVDWRRDERARETTTRERARTRERATEGRRMMRATARAMVTPRTRGVRAMTTMGASGRERIVGARRRANRARAVGEDGKWTPGPFLRPDGSPPLESYNGPTVWRRCKRS